MEQQTIKETAFFLLGYAYIAALCWHLVCRKSLSGPWERIGGGYPRAILLFPYYASWFVVVLIFHGEFIRHNPAKDQEKKTPSNSLSVPLTIFTFIYGLICLWDEWRWGE